MTATLAVVAPSHQVVLSHLFVQLDTFSQDLPEPVQAAIERLGGLAAIERYTQGLEAIATGQIRHQYAGACPDLIEGATVRDEECPACQVLLQLGKK